ncbi:MAG: TetR family transcriptional regulator C-terminal domain-containing protein [Myxococcota bacterium]|nr:TetR family transcriptional regulator C-terminal domain-containing protein [Myxococcota bacterium]
MPKLVDHDERRAKVSAPAVRAIHEQGFDRVRLVDVAKRTECTTGAVRHPALALLRRDAYAKVQRKSADGLQDLGLAEPGTDAQQLATAVFASFDGLGLRATLEPDEWSSERLHCMPTYQLAPLLRYASNGETFIPNAQAQEKTA